METQNLGTPKTFRELMEMFPSHAEFARRCGSAPDLGRVWYRRGAPPKRLRQAVVAICGAAGIPMDLETLKQISDRRADPKE